MAIEIIIAHNQDTVEMFSSANPAIQISELIDGLIMATLAVIMTLGIRNIIDNINNELYFVP